jgi:rSAM/selenodomain-associated transferase 1
MKHAADMGTAAAMSHHRRHGDRAAMSSAADVALVVIAKAPRPGRSKTRLCPPCTPAQAAALAAAALADTLAAVAATPARRRLLALDGELAEVPAGFDVVPQRGDGLGERLGNALAAAGGPALVVGMDTPQLTPSTIAAATGRLSRGDVAAVLGPALDGGYWTIGLREPDPAAFEGVPMSSNRTYAAQRRRLAELGVRIATLPWMRDVDTIEDAHAVARACPDSAFAAALAIQRRTEALASA